MLIVYLRCFGFHIENICLFCLMTVEPLGAPHIRALFWIPYSSGPSWLSSMFWREKTGRRHNYKQGQASSMPLAFSCIYFTAVWLVWTLSFNILHLGCASFICKVKTRPQTHISFILCQMTMTGNTAVFPRYFWWLYVNYPPFWARVHIIF